MSLTLRPITIWPGTLRTADERKASPFKATYRETLGVLDDELRHLDARHIVVQLAVGERDIRLDGELRAGARPEHPGVILAFESKHGALTQHTDAFDEPTWRRNGEAWHANLRAIALGLRALRAVDRYGISGSGEQYTGWKALSSGTALPAHARMDRPAAALVFCDLACDGLTTPGDVLDRAAAGDPEGLLRGLYRRAAKRLHPDSGQGFPEQFRALDEAWAVLRETPEV